MHNNSLALFLPESKLRYYSHVETGYSGLTVMTVVRKDFSSDFSCCTLEDVPMLSSKGESTSRKSLLSNVLRLFEIFRTSLIEAGGENLCVPWQELGEDVLCDQTVYAAFAHFLVNEYVIEPGSKNAGQPLSCTAVLKYLKGLVNLAANRFRATGSDKAKNFFTCLDQHSSTPDWVWFKGLKAKVQRLTFVRANAAGDEQDLSESEWRYVGCH